MKFNKTILSGVLFGLLGVTSFSLAATNSIPGSTQDPIVTKSYVDEKIDNMTRLLTEMMENQKGSQNTSHSNQTTTVNLDQKTKDFIRETIEKDLDLEKVVANMEDIIALKVDEIVKDKVGQKDVFIPLGPIEPGTVIYGEAGSEIIMRSGEGVVRLPGENGIQDITSGVDLQEAAQVPLNHLLIIPRRDGRGIEVTKPAWFMIKGGYIIGK